MIKKSIEKKYKELAEEYNVQYEHLINSALMSFIVKNQKFKKYIKDEDINNKLINIITNNPGITRSALIRKLQHDVNSKKLSSLLDNLIEKNIIKVNFVGCGVSKTTKYYKNI